MKTNIRFHFVATMMASLILLSCASTQLSHTWRDASYTAGPLKKILVVAVRKDQARRRVWEDGFAAALSAHGVDATPSYRRIAETLPDTNLMIPSPGRGASMASCLSEEAHQDDRGRSCQLGDLYDGFPLSAMERVVLEYYDREYYPGYPVINETVKDEIKIWAMQGGGRMVWTGVGEVNENGRDEDVSGEIISLIVHELVKQGVIAAGS